MILVLISSEWLPGNRDGGGKDGKKAQNLLGVRGTCSILVVVVVVQVCTLSKLRVVHFKCVVSVSRLYFNCYKSKA